MNSELAAVIARINKAAKHDVVVPASSIAKVGRTPTGNLALDVVLGGGWPQNRWVEIIGEESNGKTATLLKTIAHNQARDPDFVAVWVAAEEYDKEWAETLGVDNDRVALINTNIMEDAYQIVLTFLESKAVDLIVIDSLPALVPGAEDEKEMDQSTVGRGALLTNKFFRKAMSATYRQDGERPVVGIVINQWRQKIGVMYGDPRTTPGGVGKNYAYSTRLEVKRDSFIEIGTGDNKRKVGLTIKARTIKNKTAPPGSSALFDFYFAEGAEVDKGDYDFAKDVVTLAIHYGIVTKAGGWLKYNDNQWQGRDALLAAIRQDLDLKEDLEKQVLDLVAHKNSAQELAPEDADD